MTELFSETTEDLYDQFLNLDVATTAAFTVTDANGNTARYVKDPFPEYRWCKDCKEHDKENHCCHRFSTVIRDVIEEWRKEHEEVKTG